MRMNGFTLVEIMIVVAIIGLLALLAIPNFRKARFDALESKCVNNLRLVWAAKDQYAFENACTDSATPTEDDVRIYLKNEALPTCPYDGDHYDIMPLKDYPKCPNDHEPGCEGHRIASPLPPPPPP